MASENIVNATSSNFATEVLKSPLPVLVDFWAPWCGPCKMIAPTLEQLATENAGKARIVKVNIDDAQDLAVQFNVSSIPTLLIFKGGEVVGQFVGLKPKTALQQALNSVM